MAKKIYVGNMSYDTNEAKLTEIFTEFGKVVSAKVIEDHFTGKSKGFAFVEMENDNEALAAINALNGKTIDNRQLKVNEAFEKSRDGNNGGGGGRGGNFKRNRRF